ncbi:hypothetical protein TNCV_3546731 [Trichonephila clavipes]|nr:hypothetical protein TNCV_3546731 [Trichonephila clavipes]
MVAVGHFILALRPVRGWSRRFFVVSKVAGLMPKDKTSRYFKDVIEPIVLTLRDSHGDVVILSANGSRFTSVGRETLQMGTFSRFQALVWRCSFDAVHVFQVEIQ